MRDHVYSRSNTNTWVICRLVAKFCHHVSTPVKLWWFLFLCGNFSFKNNRLFCILCLYSPHCLSWTFAKDNIHYCQNWHNASSQCVLSLNKHKYFLVRNVSWIFILFNMYSSFTEKDSMNILQKIPGVQTSGLRGSDNAIGFSFKCL